MIAILTDLPNMHHIIEQEIEKFLSNRSSGAGELALHELQIIKKLYQTGFNEKYIKDFIKQCSNQFPQMSPILKIRKVLYNITITQQNITKIQNLLLGKKYIKHSKSLFSKSVKIMTFSNSSSIRNVIDYYSDKVSKIFCCHSLPLGEGKNLNEYFHKKSINSTLIEDSEISKYVSKVDFVLTGADAITNSFFINKIGTLQLALLTNYFQTPFYVIASKFKLLTHLTQIVQELICIIFFRFLILP